MARNSETPAPLGAATGAHGALGGCTFGHNPTTLQVQRLARAGVPQRLAVILAPAVFGVRNHG